MVVLLLGFLVLLVTSLAGLVQRDAATAAVDGRWGLARQNALLGLDAALGQLQEWAGPDRRVTAVAAGGSLVTGVWEATVPGPQPLAWLVSGNEHGEARAVGPDWTADDGIELVGLKTAGVRRRVVAPQQAVRAGTQPGDTLLGHYAWWIGDEGVKAPVGRPDRSGPETEDTLGQREARSRLAQQIGLGARPREFEPLDPVNATGLRGAVTRSQLALVQRPDGERLGSAELRGHFADWTRDAEAVLADTEGGGLRRDLSLRPELLGAAFAAWADFPSFLEDPASPSGPVPTPPAPAATTVRRRHRMRAPVVGDGVVHGVAPVLSYFLFSCNLRTQQSVSGAVRPLEVRGRGLVSLWNPYTSALVPEDLELEVSGLPEAVQVINDSSGGAVAATISLADAFGPPLRLALPWVPAGRDDQQSWLPGRTYTWATREDTTRAAPPPGGFATEFYTRNLSAAAGQGMVRSLPGTALANAATAHVRVPSVTQLTVRLFRPDGMGGREQLAEWISPGFAAFETTPAAASAGTYQFSFFFRLAESVDTLAVPETWLATPGRDPRGFPLPGAAFVSGPNGNRPELYPNFVTVSYPDRLLDRALPATAGSLTGQSYNEDAPLFELPRGPLFSIGALQHVHLSGERPFAVGNPWGEAGGWNRWFDRFFFSGLAAGGGVAEDGALPNPRLRLLAGEDGRKPDTAALLVHATDGYASKHLLQGGAFNLNSREPGAWAAVLRQVRFPEPLGMDYLAATAASGTARGDVVRRLAPGAAHFLRFSASGQETFQADGPAASATYAASTSVPPAVPSTASAANTHLFRRGVRVLAMEEVDALAGAIVAAQEQRFALAGPFRSVREFLAPSPIHADGSGTARSLLESAIATSGLNAGVAEFSSHWLTQADLMTALAPGLFARSDTFLIRTYGDAAHPVTGEIEARIWAEAEVQRMPAWVDPAQPAETPGAELNPVNARFGRRFRVVSYRWLGAEEI